jgi:GH25 family lysozyme M1 (1,4-beta-N-acetylmuramidase)
MSFGIDEANVDGNKLDEGGLTRAIAAGLSFGFFRASWDKWGDPTFKHDGGIFKAHGLPIGAYIGPDIRKVAPTPEDQINIFAANANLEHGKDFPPVLDIEFPNGIVRTGYTIPKVAAWVLRAIAAVRKTFGCSPIIYTSGRVLDDTDTDCLHGGINAIIAGLPLWLTKYLRGARQEPYLGPALPPRIPNGRDADDYWVVQDQGDSIHLPGFSNTVDIDRWNFSALGAGRGDWVHRALTTVTVKEFQASCGLDADGIIGPRTFAAMAWRL